MIKGKIERLDQDALVGWIVITDSNDEKPQLEIVIDDEVVGRCRAAEARPDVKSAGWGDGSCGIYFKFPSHLTGEQISRARVRFVGTELYVDTPMKPLRSELPPTARRQEYAGASPVFIVGSPRSGTSILVDALIAAGYHGYREGNLPGLSKLLANCIDNFFRSVDRADKRTLISNVSSHDIWAPILQIFRSILEKQNPAPPWFDKTGNPETIYVLPDLTSLWPDCKIIFAKRRGIENIVSRVRKFPEHTFRHHCADWARNMAAWRQVRRKLSPGQFLEIDQRDLITRRDEIAAELVNFLGVSQHRADMVSQILRANRPQETEAGTAERVLSIESAGWTEEQIAVFRECCEEEMHNFGYSFGADYRLRTEPSRHSAVPTSVALKRDFT